MDLLIVIALFITVVLVIEGSYFVYTAIHNPERQRLRRHLQRFSSRSDEAQPVDITRKNVLSEVPWLNRLLMNLSLLQGLSRLLTQANSAYGLGKFLLLSLTFFFTGLVLGMLTRQPSLVSLIVGGIFGILPFLSTSYKKHKRMRKFEQQLPEALELVARALRAGHTFLVGMKMVGDEFPDPIGPEFDRAVDEINFGAAVPEALVDLAQRVDCPDLHFFVTSIVVQRETGGNLAEVLEKTSHLIRQRFELLGRIRVLAGEGKLSAIILIALPFFIGVTAYFLNPDYIMPLFTEPLGQALVLAACTSMTLGTLITIKMTKIRV